MTMPFLEMWADQREQEMVGDGIRAAVRQYYADYTDATEVDYKFWHALETISEYCDEDFELLVQDVQDELARETGRRFVRAYSEDD